MTKLFSIDLCFLLPFVSSVCLSILFLPFSAVGPVESLAIVPAVAVSDVDVDESIVPVNGDE